MFYYSNGEFFPTKEDALKRWSTAWEYDSDLSAEEAEEKYEQAREEFYSIADTLDGITGGGKSRLVY